jgi:membrane-bound serine protease (ClpP class)
MESVLLIAILVLCALVLIVAEICTPSFGMLGLCAAGCLAWASYESFGFGQWAGVSFVACCVIGVPIYLSFMMKILPDTPLGRWLILRQVHAGTGSGVPEAEDNSKLVGSIGKTLTVLRPVGAVRVGGRRVIATAESGFIPSGRPVKVVKAAGSNIVVRIEEEPSQQA